ncbi:MAG: GNAT family N-acetyltransferase [Vulcanimicrobiaceae bacterium]
MSFIETERLALRTWMPGDAQEAFAIYGDPEVMRFIQGGPIAREAIPAWIEGLMHSSEQAGTGVWPAILKSERRIIGAFGLAPSPWGDVEVTWLLARSAWGQGYATEAARAVLGYAFSQFGARRVYAAIDLADAHSVALSHRLSMRFDRVVRARRRDLLRYAIETNQLKP